MLNETMLNNTAYTFKLDEEFVREAEIKNALNQRILEMGKYLLSKDWHGRTLTLQQLKRKN